MSRVSINAFIANPEIQKDNCWGFYDWFCKDSQLEKIAKGFIPKLKFLVEQGILNGDNTYVWFKNNCPCQGALYTDMRFSLMDEDNTYLGGIAPSLGYDNCKGKCELWGIRENLPPLKDQFESWRMLQKKISEDAEFRTLLKIHFYKPSAQKQLMV